MLIACLLYDCRFDRCLATWLTEYSQSASAVSFLYLRPRLHYFIYSLLRDWSILTCRGSLRICRLVRSICSGWGLNSTCFYWPSVGTSTGGGFDSSMLSKFFLLDARHALKLFEMSCVVLAVRTEGFLRQRCAELVAVSYQFDATAEVTVETLVSLLQGCHVLRRGRRPCNYLLERLFTFDTKCDCTSHL